MSIIQDGPAVHPQNTPTAHPSWCEQPCQSDGWAPEDRKHGSVTHEVELSLHLPWRSETGEYLPYTLAVQATQGVREIEPRISIWAETGANVSGSSRDSASGFQVDVSLPEFREHVAAQVALLEQLDEGAQGTD